MKKVVSIFIMLISIFSLTGCGNSMLKCNKNDSDINSELNIYFDEKNEAIKLEFSITFENNDLALQFYNETNQEESLEGLNLQLSGSTVKFDVIGKKALKTQYSSIKKSSIKKYYEDNNYTCR